MPGRGRAESATTLFRSNAIASRLLSTYFRIAGKAYLQSTLRPVLAQINAAGDIEVDPSKEPSPERIKAGMTKLLNATALVFRCITASADACPVYVSHMSTDVCTRIESLKTGCGGAVHWDPRRTLRQICCRLRSAIETRFPDSGYVGTASFLFLRFFVAAIVAPQGFGLTRRTLTPRVRWNAPGRHLIDVDGSP